MSKISQKWAMSIAKQSGIATVLVSYSRHFPNHFPVILLPNFNIINCSAVSTEIGFSMCHGLEMDCNGPYQPQNYCLSHQATQPN